MFLDCCYPTNSQLNHSNGFLRAFHRSKCYGMIWLVYYLVLAGILIAGIVLFIYFTIASSSTSTTGPPTGG
jgi:hypothetical protein